MGELREVYFSLGSNLGNRKRNLQNALKSLGRNRVQIKRVSSIYETDPIGVVNQRKFLNMAAMAETDVQPSALLRRCKSIEKRLGRTRSFRFGPRVIDIDILIYDRAVMTTSQLTLPHPRLASRNFVLIPLSEIAPRVKHPIKGKTIKYLLNHSPDKAGVEKYCEPLIH